MQQRQSKLGAEGNRTGQRRTEKALGSSLRRGQFTFYESFYEAVIQLPKSRQLEAFRAIVEFALSGAEPTLTGSPRSMFEGIRPVLESGRQKAAARLNAAAEKDAEEAASQSSVPTGGKI